MASISDKMVVEIIRRAEGGMKAHFMVLTEGLVKEGLHLEAFCDFPDNDSRKLTIGGVCVRRFDLPGGIAPFQDIKKIVSLYKFLKKNKPGVIHCHGFKAGLIGRIAGILTSCKSIYTVHNFILNGRGMMSRHTIKLIEKVLAKHTFKIIAVSESLKAYMISELGINEKKINVIYNSVPETNKGKGAIVRNQLGLSDNNILVGTVARLIPSKGIHFLIDAIPELLNKRPDLRFLIAGGGPEENNLRKKAVDMSINDRVIFAGHVENIQDYYSAFDIFVLPTLTEGLGISVLEAMAAGKPVIACRTGGIPEIIRHRDNGLLIETSNSAQIVDAVLYLANNPHIGEEYASQAQKDIRIKFSESSMIKATAKLIRLGMTEGMGKK